MMLDLCANCGDTIEAIRGRWWSCTSLGDCLACPESVAGHAPAYVS